MPSGRTLRAANRSALSKSDGTVRCNSTISAATKSNRWRKRSGLTVRRSACSSSTSGKRARTTAKASFEMLEPRHVEIKLRQPFHKQGSPEPDPDPDLQYAHRRFRDQWTEFKCVQKRLGFAQYFASLNASLRLGHPTALRLPLKNPMQFLPVSFVVVSHGT